jgi:hypothetical protein
MGKVITLDEERNLGSLETQKIFKIKHRRYPETSGENLSNLLNSDHF